MAKVILLSPPYVDLYGKLSRAAGRYFPLGLAYIASYLRKYGQHDVLMYEPEAQELTYEDIARIIKSEEPDFVGLTCSTPNFHRALELARLCREHDLMVLSDEAYFDMIYEGKGKSIPGISLE